VQSFYRRVFKRKDGLVGLAIVLFFVVVAVAAPYIVPYRNGYDPNQQYAAAPDAVPVWATSLPGYSHLPPNVILPSSYAFQSFKTASSIDFWKVLDPSSGDFRLTYVADQGPSGITASVRGAYVVVNTGAGSESLTITGGAGSPQTVYLYHRFVYDYSPPPIFYAQAAVEPLEVRNADVAVYLYLNTSRGIYPLALMATPGAQTYLESLPRVGTNYLSYFAQTQSTLSNRSWNFVEGVTLATQYMPLYYLNSSINPLTASEQLFSHKGVYAVGELILVIPHGSYSVKLLQSDLKFQVFGKAYGILGSDANGASVWSEFAMGTRVALEIGFGASALSLVIGIALGLVAGFFGGLVDSALIFVFDFLLLLPGLILLIDLDTIFTVTHAVPNKVVLIILIIGFLGFAGVSRIVRSQILGLKTRTYIDAARVMGASNGYILRNHVLKHTAGTIIALVTYIVPGTVVVDAGLDFLGLGILFQPTWGNMLANLLNEAAPSNGFLWWITLPVGASIILLSVGFYLLGTAIQAEFGAA